MSTICWPEQFPGEYEMAKKVWANADKTWPNRKRYCCDYLCRHCPLCGRFMSKMAIWSNEIGGMLAVVGQCKTHGEQCADMSNWEIPE